MNRIPNKQIKLPHVNGKMVNYGPLVNGIIGGIKILARKEILIMLKAQLVPGKVKYFSSHQRLRVRISDVLEASVYTVHERDMPRLTELFKERHKSAMRQLLLSDHEGGASWVSIPPVVQEGIRMEQIHIKTKPAKVSRLKKAWLAFKRLFSKPELEHTVINTSALDELLLRASKKN